MYIYIYICNFMKLFVLENKVLEKWKKGWESNGNEIQIYSKGRQQQHEDEDGRKELHWCYSMNPVGRTTMMI